MWPTADNNEVLRVTGFALLPTAHTRKLTHGFLMFLSFLCISADIMMLSGFARKKSQSSLSSMVFGMAWRLNFQENYGQSYVDLLVKPQLYCSYT